MRTTTQLIGSGFATVALLLAGEATALPPPMTEQELLDAADLVIDGVGMSIECDGIPIAEGNSVVTSYVSQVFPTETHKGVQMRSVVVSGQTAEWIVPVAGGWYPRPIPVGWSGRLYLEENDDGSYSELWWNATEEDQASAPETLPDCNPASGGAGGMGGSGGDTGGSAGHVSGGSAGAATGGAGDTTGGSAGDTTGGSAGDVTGGAGSGGETTGAGGSSNQAGAATGPSEDSDDDSGCSCIAAGGTNPDSRLVVVLGFLLCAAGLGRGRSFRSL